MKSEMVYVVLAGDPAAGCDMVGVYTDEGLAERVKDIVGGQCKDGYIRKHILNPNEARLDQGFLPYKVCIYRDGKIGWVRLSMHLIAEEPYEPKHYVDSPFCHIIVWANSEKHAVEVANEKREEMVTAGNWKI